MQITKAKLFLVLAAASTCASAWGANVYESHIDIYRSLSQGGEASNARPAPGLKRVMDEKKAAHRGRSSKDRLKIVSRS